MLFNSHYKHLKEINVIRYLTLTISTTLHKNKRISLDKNKLIIKKAVSALGRKMMKLQLRTIDHILKAELCIKILAPGKLENPKIMKIKVLPINIQKLVIKN
jgi:hypothetical protein